MAAKTYLIVANGLWPKAIIWKPLVQAASHVIACDGAAGQCLEQQLSVDTVIGDMDSISKEVREKILQQDSPQFIPQDGQGNNDLVKAIEWSVGQGAEHIEIIGIEGGDLAHQFAAIFALCEAPPNTRIHTTDHTIQLLEKLGYENLSIEKNTSFSLFSIGHAEGVTITGARWNLNNEILRPGTHGLHNRVEDDCLKIGYTSGQLLLFLDR
ncbi:MAG: thiamine diphosphokinase [Candidatus Poseidoniaceae archaeon]|jgi:thiamine pyrophosphokinase|tara:strand:- start:592 stop:1224 length:633 start_codon:yes stop_codon:yes gene_type:complete